MSSLRNAVQRRNHRERAQPQERSKWGLLEKHKDYSLRAADHNAKKRKLNTLRQKAADRNEDEFHFGMMSSSTDGGIKRARRGEGNGGGVVLGPEVVKLMKTQDAGYLRTVLQSTKHDRERLEQEVIVGETGVETALPSAGTKKVVFGEDVDDAPSLPPAPLENSDLDEDLSVEGDPERDNDSAPNRDVIQATRRKRHALAVRRRHLDGLRHREDQLFTALQQVDDQRARMSGTIGGVNKNGVKFKVRQRKR